MVVRQRPRGQSAVGCLLFLMALIAGGIWGYYKYLHNYSLKHAGEKITLLQEADPQTRLEYLRRMRDRAVYDVRAIGGELGEFLAALKKGRYTDPEAFKRKVGAIEARMRDTIGMLNGMGVPEPYVKGHKLTCLALKDFFHSLEAARAIRRAETREEAGNYLREAMGLHAKGRRKVESAAASIRRYIERGTR